MKEFLIDFFKSAKKQILEKSPEILLGVAIFGSISSVVMAVKATPQAEQLIVEELEKISEEKDCDISDINLTYKDYIRICWKVYIITGIMLSISIVAMILSNYIKSKRAGALATAFAITQESLRTYQNKVIEEVGKKKEEKIRDKIAKDKMNNAKDSTIILTGNGGHLFYDAFSGRYFRTTIEDVKRAQNETNNMINNDIYASVNDFYSFLGMKGVKSGDLLGWSGGMIDINFSAQISDVDHNEEPCIVIDFSNFEPFENYRDLTR